jgi:iron complex outermembrane recepter protein
LANPNIHTKALTGKIGASWKPSVDNNIYASYSRGVKSGGFNTQFSASRAAFGGMNATSVGPVGEERLDAFEIGVKNRLFDRKLSIDAALFYYDFDGKQEALTEFENLVPKFRFLNIGVVKSYGLDAEIKFAPNRRWDFSFGLGLLDTKITKSNVIALDPFRQPTRLQGLRPLETPKWTANSILAHHIPAAQLGVFTLQAEMSAQGAQNFSLTNDALTKDGARAIFNFRLLWESENGKFNAQAFVTNAFKKAYYLYAFAAGIPASAGGFLASTVNEPRLWGVKFGVRF